MTQTVDGTRSLKISEDLNAMAKLKLRETQTLVLAQGRRRTDAPGHPGLRARAGW